MTTPVSLRPSAEHDELRATVRRAIADLAPLRRRLEPEGDGGPAIDRATWRFLVENLGLAALTVPERFGGLGQGPRESVVVFEELGRGLYPGPALATVALAVPALLASEDADAAERYLPGIAGGSVVATVAAGDDGRWGLADVGTTGRPGDGGWLLDGRKSFVIDGADADLLLVLAMVDAGPTLFAVDGSAAGLRRTPMRSLDLARRIARVDFAGTPARLVGEPGAGQRIVTELVPRALVAVAAEQVGGAAACLDLAVSHARTREQFGRPIASFQAVSHKLVDMLREVEFGRSSVQYAAACLAERSAEATTAARVAAAYCTRGYRRVTKETIQVHGGLGFTWEHEAHLFYRHAWSTGQLFGSPAEHWRAISDAVGL